MKWFKGLTLAVIAGFVASGCAPKDEKTTIVRERQAPEKLVESMQVTADAGTIVLQKSALGKAFLLTPSLVISKRMPDFNDFKPQIVSFERSALRIGLFRLSANNVYDTIPTDKLLQTFRIVKETNETLSIDISEGFKNLALEEHLSIVDSETIERASEGGEGLETTMDIKEAMIRKSEINGNVMYVEQAVRIGNLSKKTPKEDDEESMPNDPTKAELTARVIIEIKPYLANDKFQSQLFDKEQRVGYFINFAFLPKQDEALPQIAKWDLSEEREAITVALENNIPAEIVKATEEGVTYWNRVVGREVLKIRHGFKATDRVSDRMIVVRWVQWDSAGFAYASMQSDPLSGEILRAQIFMTSSWLKGAIKSTQLPLGKKAGLCVFEQSQLKTLSGMVNLSEAQKLKYAQDVIRMVVAHEMGHVMGLRHNFSGSLNHEGSDEDLLKAKKDYLTDEKHPGFSLSSTVMDYEGGIETALLGAHIQHATLPYDRAVIGWGYKQEKIELAANTYCSDEHIMLANKQKAAIYGCERFDSLKNPAVGMVESIKAEISGLAASTFADVVFDKTADHPYQQKKTLEQLAQIYLHLDLGQLEDVLFKAADTLSMLSIDSVIKQYSYSFNHTDNKVTYDGLIEAKLKEDVKAFGGLSGLVKQVLNLESNNVDDLRIVENQVQEFFKTLTAAQSGLTEADLAKVSEKMLASAKDEDKKLLAKVMSKLVPVYTGQYRYSSHKEYQDAQKNPEKYKAPIMRYRSEINLGDANELMSLFKKAVLSGKGEAKKVTINGQELEVRLFGHGYERDALIKAFVLENWPASKHSEIRPALTEQLAQLKAEAVVNTLAVLKAAGQPVPESLTYAELVKAVDAIPFSQLNGIYAFELKMYDLAVLEKLEKAKPE